MTVFDILAQQIPVASSAQRVGLTGPPGAGKSSLIAMLAQRWLQRELSVGVLAIDPTSPISNGSLLGDRIRMDSIADDHRLFIRSVPSGPCHDGLCHNVVGLMGVMEAAGLSDLILETVGVGQVSYEARKLVDTLVLVLVPESGDTVQAMKAGILELADIYVINKSDRPGASQLAGELTAVLQRRADANGWRPRVLLASAQNGAGIAEIDEAIIAHRTIALTNDRRAQANVERQRYQLRALIAQRLEELTGGLSPEAGANLKQAYNSIISQMSPNERHC